MPSELLLELLLVLLSELPLVLLPVLHFLFLLLLLHHKLYHLL